MGQLIFPHWLIIGLGGQKIDLNLGHRGKEFKIIKLYVGFYVLITSYNFLSVRSSTLDLSRSQSCKKVMWGRVIQIDLVT